jgi:cobalt-precorrin-5B (C1)-methyltransferase
MASCHRNGEDREAVATVIKDAGDDPDITHRAVIGATVRLVEDSTSEGIVISGGKGVGTVTKRGLEVPVGQAAINPGPRTMITNEIREALQSASNGGAVHVEVFVPEGETLAKNTLNARLGILGGISILGTTGIVRPMSHDAYIATIKYSFSVAAAMGVKQVVLTTGRRSEKFSQALMPHLPEEAFIQIGDFFKASLTESMRYAFQTITLAVFFGKAVKMAMGIPHTHAAKAELTLRHLAQWAREITGSNALAEQIRAANTARHAFDDLIDDHMAVIHDVGRRMVRSARHFTGTNVHVQGLMYDFDGNLIFDSDQK